MALQQHRERLDGLAPFLQRSATELLQLCETKLRRVFLVTQGWRSLADQRAIYSKGRAYDSATGLWTVTDATQLVTRALPGTSPHNVITRRGGCASLAFDGIPLLPDGTPDWDVDDNFWDALYELAWKVGLDPLGDPIGAYLKHDKGHFEEPGWKLKLEGLDLILPDAGVTV